MASELGRADLGHLVRAGDTVFVAGGTGEPTAILAVWRETGLPDGVTLVGCQIPGLNWLAPEEIGTGCRFRTAFLSPGLRTAARRGLVDLMPMHHTAFYAWLEREARLDLGVLQVSPPDSGGLCNLGPCADFVPALLARPEVRLVAQINPRLPRCRGSASVAIDRFDGWFLAETDLPTMATVSGGDLEATIADRVAAFVRDGDTVQIGIGRLPDHVLRRLMDRGNLKLHSGTVSSAALDMLECGAVDSIVAGLAAGNAGFYVRAAASSIAFRPVPETHGSRALAKIPRLMALNAALEVDLFGQANCEVASGRLLASVGGINNFMRAARESPGGLAVLMLPAQSSDGQTSRVVSRIGEPGLVSVQRGDVDVVVTEHGVADLRGLDIDARAAGLIAVAAPGFRASLAADWQRVRGGLA